MLKEQLNNMAVSTGCTSQSNQGKNRLKKNDAEKQCAPIEYVIDVL